MMEDHHISRLEKGAYAHLQVQGADNPTEFQQNVHHVDSGTPITQLPSKLFEVTEEPPPPN